MSEGYRYVKEDIESPNLLLNESRTTTMKHRQAAPLPPPSDPLGQPSPAAFTGDLIRLSLPPVELVEVDLSNDNKPAIVEAEVLAALQAWHLGTDWIAHRNNGRDYIEATLKEIPKDLPQELLPTAFRAELEAALPHRVVISRLIAGASRGDKVFYRDGDPFNLVRSNLKVIRKGEGRGGGGGWHARRVLDHWQNR